MGRCGRSGVVGWHYYWYSCVHRGQRRWARVGVLVVTGSGAGVVGGGIYAVGRGRGSWRLSSISWLRIVGGWIVWWRCNSVVESLGTHAATLGLGRVGLWYPHVTGRVSDGYLSCVGGVRRLVLVIGDVMICYCGYGVWPWYVRGWMLLWWRLGESTGYGGTVCDR